MSGDALYILATLLMFLMLAVSILPFIPGPALLWAIGTLVAVSNNFERVTVLAVVLMTVFMLVGSTSDLWMRSLGMKTRGGSCWGILGSFIGGAIGTGIFPIIGTLIGALIGALLVEYMRLGDLNAAIRAGRMASEMFIISLIVEFAMSVAIFGVFLSSLWLTA